MPRKPRKHEDPAAIVKRKKKIAARKKARKKQQTEEQKRKEQQRKEAELYEKYDRALCSAVNAVEIHQMKQAFKEILTEVVEHQRKILPEIIDRKIKESGGKLDQTSSTYKQATAVGLNSEKPAAHFAEKILEMKSTFGMYPAPTSFWAHIVGDIGNQQHLKTLAARKSVAEKIESDPAFKEFRGTRWEAENLRLIKDLVAELKYMVGSKFYSLLFYQR